VRADLVVRGRAAWFLGRRFPCEIGRRGVSAAKREGDGCSPLGAFALRLVLWRADRGPRPRGVVPTRAIGPRDGWSDDPGDPLYNRAIRRPHPFSHERLRRADRVYDLLVTTSHNELGAPGAGSAIFVHLRRGPGRPTAGCVAFDRAALRWILARWRPRSRLVIVGARALRGACPSGGALTAPPPRA
jgi:L,D-peptidoglycan transpeptidase YkuD (ErfK/YbiS/YcfS/YnhG family)